MSAGSALRFVLSEPGADLVVATQATLERTIAAGPRHLLVEGGRGARELGTAGYEVSRYMTLPDATEPAVVVPLGAAAAARYAFGVWLAPAGRVKQVTHRLAAELVARNVLVRGRGVAIATKAPGPPFLVSAAEKLGVPVSSTWFLVPGAGDALSRGVFQIFEGAGREPAWALKFARVPDYDEQFARDERGLRLAKAAGGAAQAHAPRLVGRFVAGGVHASVESAATGRRLIALLATGAEKREKLHAIEQVAAWTVAVGAETARNDEDDGERAQVLQRIASAWHERGVPAASADALRFIPSVLEHRDLGSWNVVVGRETFVVVDWEDATRAGFPLWDLWYLLADALAHLDGVGTDGQAKERHFVQLFRGELPTSALLFALTRRTVSALRLREEDVSRLALLAWLWHGTSHLARHDALDRLAPGGTTVRTGSERRAELWLAEPGLGPDWSSWRS